MAALALREAGYEVRAATVKLWPGDDERSCCSPAAVARARDSAHAIGRAALQRERRAALCRRRGRRRSSPRYLAGETPNPCVECNPGRLARLVELADRFGAAWVATGHYARVVRAAGEPRVARGRDRAKDQSYMLWRVPPETLERLLLPLGELTKPEVRERARRRGAAAGRPARQSGGLLRPRRPSRVPGGARRARARPARSSIATGRVLGRHGGCWRFTVGQRRGLAISAAQPLYVLAIEASRGRVVVGPARGAGRARSSSFATWSIAASARATATVSRCNCAIRPTRSAWRVWSGCRALAPGSSCGTPFRGVAPGQSAVFYRDDVVVGGGIIAAGTARRSPGSHGCDKVTAQSRGRT